MECIITGEGPRYLALHGAMGGCDQSDLLARRAVNSSQFRIDCGVASRAILALRSI